MSNISSNINLRQLKSEIRTFKGVSGQIECLVIPIAANHLVKGEKGVYLNLTGFEIKDRKPDRKDTHLVKQSFPKEIYDAMTEDQKQAAPILGNMTLWGHQEPAPQEFAAGDLSAGPEEDDLPF